MEAYITPDAIKEEEVVTSGELELLAENSSLNPYIPKHGQIMRCSPCKRNFKGRREYIQHQKVDHPDGCVGTIKCHEKHCTFSCFKISKLADHLGARHGMDIIHEQHVFTNNEEFLDWKHKYEEENLVKYLLSSSKDKGGQRYYNCSRTGFYEPKANAQKRGKHKGTSKINGHCVSGMSVKRHPVEGSIEVSFVKSHYLHTTEVNHLRMSVKQKKYIESLLALGKSPDSIVTDVNALRCKGSMAVVTKKDVLNVCYSYTNKRLDEVFSYRSSLQDWKKEKEGFDIRDCVLYHKAKGDRAQGFNDADFVMVLMTKLQQENVHRYALDGLCCEVYVGIQPDKSYGFLFILFGVDTMGKNGKFMNAEVPLAFCVSNNSSDATKTKFFSSIRDACGIIRSPFLIINEWSSIYDAWSAVMREADKNYEILRIVSPWEVNSILEERLKKHVKSTPGFEKASQLAHNVKSETTFEGFEKAFKDLVKTCSESVSLVPFGQEFVKTFQGKTGWAACHYIEFEATVKRFGKCLTETLRKKKLSYFCNKKIGRCVNQVMRYYTSKIIHFDDSFVRTRRRPKRSRPNDGTADTSKRGQESEDLVGIIARAIKAFCEDNKDVKKSEAEWEECIKTLKKCEEILKRKTLSPDEVASKVPVEETKPVKRRKLEVRRLFEYDNLNKLTKENPDKVKNLRKNKECSIEVLGTPHDYNKQCSIEVLGTNDCYDKESCCIEVLGTNDYYIEESSNITICIDENLPVIESETIATNTPEEFELHELFYVNDGESLVPVKIRGSYLVKDFYVEVMAEAVRLDLDESSVFSQHVIQIPLESINSQDFLKVLCSTVVQIYPNLQSYTEEKEVEVKVEQLDEENAFILSDLGTDIVIETFNGSSIEGGITLEPGSPLLEFTTDVNYEVLNVS